MEPLYDNRHIYDNFMRGDRTQYPLDLETLEALQNNTSLCAVLGRMAGSDRVILCGCDGQPRNPGYVWMATDRAPLTGEILYYEGGGTETGSCHIEDHDEDIRIDSTEYPAAYTRRHLANGIGVNGAPTYTLGGFVTLPGRMTLARLLERIEAEEAARHAAVESLKNNARYTFVRGMIMLWSGSSSDTIPDGWAFCDGRSYTIDGETVRTPDLRDKFVMGAKGMNGSGDREDYNTGQTGGGSTHSHSISITLRAQDIPIHRHMYCGDENASGYDGIITKRTDLAGRSGSGGGDGGEFLTGSKIYDDEGTLRSTTDERTVNVNSDTKNHLPPYYILAHIMKL